MATKTPSPTKKSRSAAAWAERERLVSNGSAAYTNLVLDRALNATVWDVDGKEYVDFAGGIGALNVGHCHPKVVAALREQAGKLLHTSFHVAAYENYMDVCRELIAVTPGAGAKKAILFNSGSEAIENAVKFARAFTKRRAVVAFDNAFHGRTLLCLALDGKYKPLRQGFGPSPAEIYHARFPYAYRAPRGVKPEELTDHCLEALERFFQIEVAAEDVAAIIIEPVQGEGGFVVPTSGFMKALRGICDKHGIVLIIDEVQSGFGRTGELFAIEHDRVAPDLMVVGKSLCAGMPLSGVVGRAEILDAAATGAIGGTYGGNPMSCAAALAVFEIFKEEKLVEAARRIGMKVQKRFDALRDRHDFVGDSRGLGAMRALELVTDKKSRTPLPAARVKEILHACVDRGLILIKAGAHDNVLRTLMPLTIGDKELGRGLDVIDEVLGGLKL
ncbi:MAG TPA: 4-aminobutyrate--2-oxoglutarate transaminase [Elusimicrobiota bacterium]|jgi:4-aminobutyrate aminotransferase/(S)-3-amino-2-methylpropionate transaminase|nr:4-aminobutyrate--2-oxoglutarate transaminase [Elusimicrobiota bacterium]